MRYLLSDFNLPLNKFTILEKSASQIFATETASPSDSPFNKQSEDENYAVIVYIDNTK
jgi:hypothetical protein